MNKIKGTIAISVLLLLVLSISAFAQPVMPDPGILPNSPFYFIDTIFDNFRPASTVADRKVSEMVVMAENNDAQSFAIALNRYEKAMFKLQTQARESTSAMEQVAEQATKHLAVLSEVRSRVPTQAYYGIDTAMQESANGRENALSALKTANPQRYYIVSDQTIEYLNENTPEEAQEGVDIALEYVSRERIETKEMSDLGEERGLPINTPRRY